MASKSVKLYQDIQQNPELRKLNTEVNKINDRLASMGRSEYFKGISLPEQLNKYDVIESAKINFSDVQESLNILKQNLDEIWNARRSSEAVQARTGIVKSEEAGFIKVLSIMPESAIKRTERTGRGKLSEKAVKILIANDVEMLKRLTHKSEADIMDFLNAYYEAIDISGGQLLENFVEGVYKSEYAGSGASQSWGSPTVKNIINEKIIETYDIEIDYDENIEASWETEAKMGNELYDKWMKLFN